ncbi:hypothetical protein Fmac_026485 [Flemingia macrophylla]|uniref:O-fucosyltransferase family protein n=1 Tax=Flemingia macrophylla TaxID=520843 RepID=A0ABD1LF19_9FABA
MRDLWWMKSVERELQAQWPMNKDRVLDPVVARRRTKWESFIAILSTLLRAIPLPLLCFYSDVPLSLLVHVSLPLSHSLSLKLHFTALMLNVTHIQSSSLALTLDHFLFDTHLLWLQFVGVRVREVDNEELDVIDARFAPLLSPIYSFFFLRIHILASSLSLTGSTFIVLCYLLKELRKFSFKLVFLPCTFWTHPKVSFVMLRDIAHISFVWQLFYGLQQLLLPCTALLYNTKQMLKIWRPCFTCMSGICDVVAVDKILNATLVIPHFEVNPVWQDSSLFAYIFDVDHFIDVLYDEVSIVKELPNDYSWSTREYYGTGIRATRIKIAPVQAITDCYIENVLPVL